MGQFRDAPGPAVIANVRVLTEGIDTPSADGVIFVDPRYSQIDIAQAIGRALRKSAGKAYSLVMIPAFTDNLDDYDETLHKGEFAEVAAIVKRMGFDERIEAKIRLATQQGPWKPPLKQKESAEWVAEDVVAYEWSEAMFLAVFDRKSFMRTIPEGTICQVPCGCTETAIRRWDGVLVCNGHYQQGRKGRQYVPLAESRRGPLSIPEGMVCQVSCGCVKLATHSHNDSFLCDAHYMQGRQGKEYTVLYYGMPKGQICQVPCGCSKPASQRQNDLFVCKTHVVQWQRAQRVRAHHPRADP